MRLWHGCHQSVSCCSELVKFCACCQLFGRFGQSNWDMVYSASDASDAEGGPAIDHLYFVIIFLFPALYPSGP